MPAASLPFDEPARLQTLRSLDVLDSVPETFSNAIAAAAAAIAGVPISAISLVDTDRQWFKARCGLDTAETPRDFSFCAHAILDIEPLLIEDAAADDRFLDNPLVLGPPHIRAYAGFPLVVAGRAVGALCVIDDRPRVFGADVVAQLRQLAAGTASWLGERRQMTGTLERTREKLRQMTFQDPSTGLSSRLLLQDRLQQAVARADRTRQRVAVLFLRIGVVASTGGAKSRRALDSAALREVAARLEQAVRGTDAVARVGDGDFVILAEGPGNLEAARRLALSVRAALDRPLQRGDGEDRLDARVGVALYPQDGPGDRLVAYAEMASMQPGADSVCGFFRAEIVATEQRRARLLADLRRAQQNGEFHLDYQPQLDARSGAVTRVEALLRWRHPEFGELASADFVPLAEEAGLIDAIGGWAIGAATGQLRRWRDRGIALPLALNLSACQLRRTAFAQEVEALLQAENADPASITFELAEAAAMDTTTTAGIALDHLAVVGVRIAIADFGAGSTSLVRLRRLPVQQLKIDRGLVAELQDGNPAHEVVRAIVQMAHALRLEVVAVGVETEAQRALLVDAGCDTLQGFLLGRPMGADTLFDWLAARGR